MERQAGLGRSLEEVLDSVPPIEPLDPAPTHALFGIGPEEAPVTNGTPSSDAHADTRTKNDKNKNKNKKKSKKSDGETKQSKQQQQQKKKKKKSKKRTGE